MSDAVATDVRGRYAALSARLDGADGSVDRSALKADIIELFRTVERELAELGALKEDVKKLVERWKAIGGATQTPALQPAAPPLRADRIGSDVRTVQRHCESVGDHVIRQVRADGARLASPYRRDGPLER